MLPSHCLIRVFVRGPTFPSSFSLFCSVSNARKSKLSNNHILGEIVKVVLPEVHTVIDSHNDDILGKSGSFIAFKFTRSPREMSNAE